MNIKKKMSSGNELKEIQNYSNMNDFKLERKRQKKILP